jgi:ubiquinone/menaquinone biosynthesis C-methylase UbiE
MTPANRSFPDIIPAGGDTGTPLNLRKRLRLLQLHGAVRGRRVLDCGCGAGEYVSALRAAGVEAYGVEYQAEKVAIARQRGLGEDLVRQGDLARLDYPDESFELAFLNEVLEHVPDEKRALKEVARVLKPGGGLIVFSPNRLYPFETHGVSLRRSGRPLPPYTPLVPYIPLAVGRKFFSYWARNYWPGELASLVRSAGFELRSTSYLWQTFENISGRQPRIIRATLPIWRALAMAAERIPLIRRLGVSQVLVATKSL